MKDEQKNEAPVYAKWVGIALMVLLPLGLVAFFLLAPSPEEDDPTGPGTATRPNATSTPTEDATPTEAPVAEEPEDEDEGEPTEPRPTDGDAWYDYDGKELSRDDTAALEDKLSTTVEHYYSVSASETQEERTKRLSPLFLPDSPQINTNPLTDGALEAPDSDGRVDLIANVSMVETLQATDKLYSGWMEVDTQIVITGKSEEDNYILQGTVVVGVLAAKGDDGVWYVKEIREQTT